jgi:tetratricopeptide (TPR) repeat protein
MLAASSASITSPSTGSSLADLNYNAFKEAYNNAQTAVTEKNYQQAEALFLQAFDFIPVSIIELDLDKAKTVVEFWEAYNHYNHKNPGAQKPAQVINPRFCNKILEFLRENKDVEANIKVGLIQRLLKLYQQAGNTPQTVACAEQLIDMVEKNEVPGKDFVSDYCESLYYLAQLRLGLDEIDKQNEAAGIIQKIIARPELMPSGKIKYIGAWIKAVKNRLQAEKIYAPEAVSASIKSILDDMSASDTSMPVPLIYSLFFEVLLKLHKNYSELSRLYHCAAQCVSPPVSAAGMSMAFDLLDFIKRLCELIDWTENSLHHELVWILKIVFKTIQKNPEVFPQEIVASWVQKVLISLDKQDVPPTNKVVYFRRALTQIEKHALEARLTMTQNYLKVARSQISALTTELSKTRQELAQAKTDYAEALETITHKNQQLVNTATNYLNLQAQFKQLQNSSNSTGAAGSGSGEASASGEGVGSKRSHAQAFENKAGGSASSVADNGEPTTKRRLDLLAIASSEALLTQPDASGSETPSEGQSGIEESTPTPSSGSENGAKGAFAVNRPISSSSSAEQAAQASSSAPRL